MCPKWKCGQNSSDQKSVERKPCGVSASHMREDLSLISHRSSEPSESNQSHCRMWREWIRSICGFMSYTCIVLPLYSPLYYYTPSPSGLSLCSCTPIPPSPAFVPLSSLNRLDPDFTPYQGPSSFVSVTAAADLKGTNTSFYGLTSWFFMLPGLLLDISVTQLFSPDELSPVEIKGHSIQYLVAKGCDRSTNLQM